MLTPVTGKVKAARVSLEYFRNTGTDRKKWGWIAFGIAGVLLIISIASGWWKDLASPGKLHAVHSAWEHDCAVCHVMLKPTSSTNGLHTVLKAGEVSDDLCKNCHAGTPHHTTQVMGREHGSCASCHVEHRGRYSRLAHVDDVSCTHCHKDLKNHAKESPEYANTITRFDRDHPQFKLGPPGDRKPLGEAKDPGKLKFNHKLHLTAGLRYSEKDAGNWTYSRITDQALRERYRKEQPDSKDDSPVQLDCASCHNLDVSDAPKPAPGKGIPPRSTGDYMLAVNYDQHCKACHPLTFEEPRPNTPNVEVPHHLQMDEVRDFLKGVFSAKEVKEFKEKTTTDRPLPGINVSREEKEARERINGNVRKAESFLFQPDEGKAIQFVTKGKTTCGLCHVYAGEPGKEKILPPDIPQLWYPHATFSHRAHKAVECGQCHVDVKDSTQSKDVMIPGLENCQKCHGASTSSEGHKRGGVRYDCATCHLYHNGDAFRAGLGAAARDAKQKLSITDFLEGKIPKQK